MWVLLASALYPLRSRPGYVFTDNTSETLRYQPYLLSGIVYLATEVFWFSPFTVKTVL